MAETTNPPTAPAMPELFACERLSARLTVKYCGSRFLRVRAATVGSADYDSACDRCPVGEHHARTGTMCPDTQTQTPATTTKEKTMAAHSEYTDDQKRAAAKRVLIGGERREDVGKELGVSGTTVSNWVKRFGTEVASDAMDAAAGKEPKAKVAKATKLERAAKAIAEPKPKRAAKEAEDAPEPPGGAYLDPAVARNGRELPADAGVESALARFDRRDLGRLGYELSLAVRLLGDKASRTAVADAAWLLTQAANG